MRVERERLRDLALEALEADVRRAAASGDRDRALTAAYAAVRIAPLRDSSVGVLIQILLSRGSPAVALRTYHGFYRRLKAIGSAALGGDASAGRADAG